MKEPKSPNSFTLIEVLMVCALLAFLMAIMVGGYSIASTKMAEADCRATMEKIATALEAYKAKHGYYIQAATAGDAFYVDAPITGSDFSDFLTDFEKMKKTGALIEVTSGGRSYLVDPYGTAYRYQCPGANNRMTFDIYSAGPDATWDNEDDLKNWE